MDNINWDDIYIQLYAYADQLLKKLVWFRKSGTDSYIKGKQAHDYAIDAIEKYLLAPGKYNSSTGRSLVTYLQWHIVRTAISNDVRSAENITTSDILSHNLEEDENNVNNYEAILPFVIASFDENIDYNTIMREIEAEVQHDPLAKIIFDEVRCNGNNRRDVIEQNQLSENDYDNAMKRLKTVLRKISKRYVL